MVLIRLALVAVFLALPLAAAAQSLTAQLAEAVSEAERWRDINAAKRAGWRPFGGEAPLMGRHYSHPSNPDYVFGQKIDFSRPNNLVYYEVEGRQALVALAYIVRKRPSDPLPAGFAGQRDIWHVHDGRKFIGAIEETRPFIGRIASRWFNNSFVEDEGRSQLAMVHVWLVPNPKGRFASHNPALAYRDAGLPAAWASGDMDAARGIALSEARGCDNALEAELWLSGASRAKQRTILGACRSIAEDIRRSLTSGEAQIESRASAGWKRLEDIRFMTLSASERRRAAAFVEDGPGVCR
ncbi:MAG: hypothetical protein AAFR35_04630 [Pseudomonadota bacterium]